MNKGFQCLFLSNVDHGLGFLSLEHRSGCLAGREFVCKQDEVITRARRASQVSGTVDEVGFGVTSRCGQPCQVGTGSAAGSAGGIFSPVVVPYERGDGGFCAKWLSVDATIKILCFPCLQNFALCRQCSQLSLRSRNLDARSSVPSDRASENWQLGRRQVSRGCHTDGAGAGVKAA